ncbi:hypothetical protein [Halorubrum sp. C191]|uniref:hypothetical protein n=1 Tax=Halorubrum sp. C191 TaxID=1383842 RepID=UPI001181C5E6|nr:hypothetical protein [Halorubrum sp. C191]
MSYDPPSPPTDWAYEYTAALADVAEFGDTQSTRSGVFDALCDLTESPGQTTPAVLSTTAIADIVENKLVSKGISQQPNAFTRGQFNQLYPEFERLAVGYRLPKLSRDDHYYIFPTTPLTPWLAQIPREPFLKPEHEPDGYGTCLFGDYLTAHMSTTEPTAGTVVPLEALFYSTVGKYAPVDTLTPEKTHTFTPETVDIEVCTGDIETLQATEKFEVNTLTEQLSLNTTLPPVDEDVLGGAHDIGLFGHITLPAEIELAAHDLLERQLASQLESWTAGVLALYAAPETASENEDDDTDGRYLSRNEFGTAVNRIAAQSPRNHINRYGLDTRVSSPDDSDRSRVVCGIYRRTNEDIPVDPTPSHQ